MKRLVAAAVLVAASAGAWRAVRLVWAEFVFRKGDEQNIRRAIALEPGRAEYRIALADLLGPEGIDELERAVELNPWNAGTLIELGVRAEMRGDVDEAERLLLQAAHVNRTYDPCWALANFYYRKGASREFWIWAQRAAEMAHSNTAPLFRLMWNMGGADANRWIPPKPELERKYLVFLLSTGRLDAAVGMAARLRERASPEDQAALLAYCEHLIRAGRAAEAAPVWNEIVSHEKRIGSTGLVDGVFRQAPTSRGFDWRLPQIMGVNSVLDGAALRIEYTGRQPERCEGLYQYLLLEPDRKYRLVWEYRTREIPAKSGLKWRVMDGSGVLAESGDLASEEWAHGETTFEVLSVKGAPRLALFYQRAKGTKRIEGAIWLRNIALEVAP